MNRFLLGLAVGIAVTAVLPAAEHTKDTPADVKKAVADGKAVLIDVREESEWKDGHLAGAKSLPLSVLNKGQATEKLKAVVPAGKIVYMHCAAGGRCLKAAELLKDAGYDIRPLKPGYEALLKDGFNGSK